MSVDKYLALNTSEDNVSFEQLMGEARKKEQSKVINQWLMEKERLHELVSLKGLPKLNLKELIISDVAWPKFQ